MIKDEYYLLSNGVKIPKIGFGTWQSKDGQEAYNSVKYALKAGYRHIDTALVYGNEKSVGQAIKDSKIKREEIFICTKIPAEVKNYQGAKECFEQSLVNLDCEYLDLYLIHAPWPWNNVGQDCHLGNIEVWKAIVELYNEKKIRAIGVSNFHPQDIQYLIDATGVVPQVNQIRYFIGNRQDSIVEYCEKNNILVEAYSPLATGEILDKQEVMNIALKYNTTLPKLCIRYCLEKGTLPLPKSVHEERIIANIDVDFTINKEDMDYLDSLNGICSKRPLRS